MACNGGLYIHIPFCVRKCPYCDFYSITDDTLRNDFISSLIKEIEQRKDAAFSFDTLYIGGGTPSVLNTADMDRIVNATHQNYALPAETEVTIEVNPGTINLQQLRDFRRLGINRINIGIQSFQSDQLQFLGRIHTKDDGKRAIEYARMVGFDQIGVDLIYGIPGQTKQSWLDDLVTALGFQPEHLSCYMLTYESGTPLDVSRRSGEFQPVDDKSLADLFKTTVSFLKEKGYDQYEVSNFEKSDPSGHHRHRSVHNRKYWTYAPYLGFGPSAHSFIEPTRSWNVRDIETYLKWIAEGQTPRLGEEVLSRDQQMTEWIYLGLRQTDGIPIDRFNEKFNTDFYHLFEDDVADLEESGFLMANPSSCSLTLSGMLLLDSIVERLISLIGNGHKGTKSQRL